MIQPVTIDIFDPLLPAFAFQHDLRERFLEALEDIASMKVADRHYKAAFERCVEIAKQATDEQLIADWDDAGRPLRMDSEIGEEAIKVDLLLNSILNPESQSV